MSTIKAKKLGEKYLLLDLLGIGGMAEIYRSKLLGEKGFEKQIVIKKLLPQAAQDKEMVRLFINEARLAAMLQHENIAATYDFGEIDGSYFLAMEYLSGVNLHTLLKRTRDLGNPLEVRYALFITSKICEGMDYAHRLKDFQNKPLNIIHRDLTPHNIFITYDGKVKVLDFGVAKAEILDNKTQAGVVKGKLSYMSPEQISGETIDSRSDIFTIGILIYEMVSGRRMYSGDTAALIQKCLTVEYEHLNKAIPDLPPELYVILDKALERDREERYQSCSEMLAEIEDLMFSMAKRPDAKSLQNYVRGLVGEEYKAAVKRATMAMDSRTTETEPPGQDKTVVFQGDSDEQAITHDGTKADSKGPQSIFRQEFNVRLLTDKKFLIGATLALIVLAVLVIPAMFKKDDTYIYTPPAVTHSPPAPQDEKAVPDKSQVIAELYSKAEFNLAANRLFNPSDDCALKYYHEILNLDPANTQALAGLNRIGDRLAAQAELEYKESNFKKANHYVDLGLQVVPEHKSLLELKNELANLEMADRYASLATKAMTQGRMAEAQEYIDKGLIVSPNYERLLTLHARFAKEIESTVNELTEKARQRLEDNNLTTPVGDSALSYFDEIKKIDPDNKIASNGYQEIANRYASMANEAYRTMNIEKAREYVNRGLEVVPDHEWLLALKFDLSRSKPELFIKSVGKNIETLLNR